MRPSAWETKAWRTRRRVYDSPQGKNCYLRNSHAGGEIFLGDYVPGGSFMTHSGGFLPPRLCYKPGLSAPAWVSLYSNLCMFQKVKDCDLKACSPEASPSPGAPSPRDPPGPEEMAFMLSESDETLKPRFPGPRGALRLGGGGFWQPL